MYEFEVHHGEVVHVWRGPGAWWKGHNSGRFAMWEQEPLTGQWMWRLTIYGNSHVHLGYVQHESQVRDWLLRGVVGYH